MKCLTAIKLVAITSLGISTGGLAFSSYSLFKLSTDIKTQSSQALSNALNLTIKLAAFASIPLAWFAATAFSVAFTYAPLRARHPYLVYAAVGSLLSTGALAHLVRPALNAISKDPPRLKRSKKLASPKRKEEVSSLDDSIYVDLKESVSPEATTGVEADSDDDDASLEFKIKDSIYKDDTIKTVKVLKRGFAYSSSVGLVTILLATIGLAGDRS
ncbi:unnamed protein product [Kuraishia capsulata CBS 1993]|uniref:Autophagy-related protein 33 n=1 Tax=Kuraishia capsulata CBS 1993 TaxID=1382522 RepID=W6MNM3_9ASCO|nr:uncharacterized protein KUCA_T00002625001 [Kuraishia capsulata CBS 1993]CDK26652.1 unnamed protein product [Kuraishia capsulata CBS 1993]